jgi:cardiolipin synthase
VASAEPHIEEPGKLQFAEHVQGEHRARWIATVDDAYAEMERRINAATVSVRVETYILREEGPAGWLREALLAAKQRGLDVRLLVDAFGADEHVRGAFLQPLRDAGVTVKIFNPQRWLRRSFRNHRKLLACDGEHAILGGFNIAPEYAGDGVTQGWLDTALYVGGPIVPQLEASFDAMLTLAPFTPPAMRRFRKALKQGFGAVTPAPAEPPVQLLMTGPYTHGWVLRRRLAADMGKAHDIAIAAAYFLPASSYRRLLYRAAKRGPARILLPGKSDVAAARLAAERYYGRLLSRNVQIFEYQPQILHAKLLIADDVVYVGSANLDRRSLHINYELLLRFSWPELAADARRWFEQTLAHSEQVDLPKLRQRRGIWRRLLSWLSYLLLARVDPLLARRGFRNIS